MADVHRICPCETPVEEPGPHIAACPFFDIDYEPCFCGAKDAGPSVGTPYGICRACACSKCLGFRWRDDRGFLVKSQPFVTKTACEACGGVGTRAAEAAR